MSALVEKLSQRKWQAYCPVCSDGINTTRQVDAHIWASQHNQAEHSSVHAGDTK